MNEISHLRPISDVEAACAVSEQTHADLIHRITAMPAGERAARSRARRRRRIIAIPLAIGVVAAVALATLIGTGGSNVGPVNLGPGNAQALSFKTEGRFILVIVRNPLADVRRYRAELAAHHLNVTLRLVPASPSLIGTVVEGSGPSEIAPITARGKCWTGGGGNVCPVGIKIPINFRGSAGFTFGRAARPGEQYLATAPATAQGEAMHGLRFRGRTVAAVLAMLRARHVTVPQYRWLKPIPRTVYSYALKPNQVPEKWYVHDAVPWARGQVLLFVGPHRNGR